MARAGQHTQGDQTTESLFRSPRRKTLAQGQTDML